MSFHSFIELSTSDMPLPHWGPNGFGESAGDLHGDNAAVQRPPDPSDPHMLEESDIMATRAPVMRMDDTIVVGAPIRDIHEADNIAVAPPAFEVYEDDNIIVAPEASELDEDDNIVVASPVIHDLTHLESSLMNNDREADGNDGDDIDYSDSDSESDRTVSGWELDEEFVGLEYDDDDSDIGDNAASVSHAFEAINRMDIATIAPHAAENLDWYSERVGEILTHESWQRIIAGIPPGMPIPKEEPRGCSAEPVFEPAVNFEDDNMERPRRAQSEATDDIYGAPPPPAALDEPKASNFDYGRAEAEFDGSQSLAEAENADDKDEDPFTGFPAPKEDKNDNDFLPGYKRAPRRKAPGNGSASARKQTQKARGRAQGSFAKATVPAQRVTLYSSSEAQRPGDARAKQMQIADSITAASPTPGPAFPPAAPVNTAPSHGMSAGEETCSNNTGEYALRLRKAIADLRGEVRLAEARYEEAANNPRAATDPRTKKRRMDKLEATREKLRKAVEEQEQFEERYGSVRSLTEDIVDKMSSTGSASSSSASTIPIRLQVLEQEVSKWSNTIQDLLRKVAHCQAQLDDVEAHPEKFEDKRVGFKRGRLTRLENAQYSLSHNLRMLNDKQQLYDKEYRRVHGVALSEGQAGQQARQQEPDQEASTPAADQLQLSASQRSTPRKRKDSEMEEEEEMLPGSSKRRLDTPV